MAKSVLDILIKLSKQGNADKETITGLVKLKSSFMDAAAVAGSLVAAGYAVKKVFDATVGTMVEYADQVRTTSRATQLGAEESSRLIQMTDDLGVSYEGLEKAIKSSSDTTDFSIAGLMKTSEEYLKITDAQERAKFAQKQYGKAWIEMIGVLEKGPDAIKAASEAIADNLVLTDEAVKQAREYEIALDNVADSWMGIKVSAGGVVLPLTNDGLRIINSNITAITTLGDVFTGLDKIMLDYEPGAKRAAAANELIEEWAGKIIQNNLPSFMKSVIPAVDSAAVSYMGWAKALEGAQSQTTNATLALEAQEAAIKSMTTANQGFLSTMGSIQSAEESYADTSRSLLEERAQIEQDRADAISQGWGQNSDKVREYDAALIENNLKARENAIEHEMANKKIILGLLERKLTADGVLDDKELQWLLDKGVAWGVYSQTVVDETARAITEANNLVDAINAIPTSKDFTLNIFREAISSQAAANPGRTYYQGGKASGGPVSANSAYVVGEEGPELFVPNQSGMIIPNGGGAGSGGVGGAASSIVVNLSMNSVVSMADRESMKRLTPFIIDGIREAQAQGYIK